MSSPGGPQRPDDTDRPHPWQGNPPQGRPWGSSPSDEPAAPPYVYNPYGNVTYPASYPVPPAGLGPDEAVPTVRRPGSMVLALVLLVLATLPYLLVGFLAAAAAGAVEAAVPPEQLAQFRQSGVDLEQLVRTTGVLLLVIAAVYVVLAALAFTGRRWARALLAAMTVGFVLMVVTSVVAASAQGVTMDGASLVVIAGPVLLAVVGVALMFGAAARVWFSRPRAPRR